MAEPLLPTRWLFGKVLNPLGGGALVEVGHWEQPLSLVTMPAVTPSLPWWTVSSGIIIQNKAFYLKLAFKGHILNSQKKVTMSGSPFTVPFCVFSV